MKRRWQLWLGREGRRRFSRVEELSSQLTTTRLELDKAIARNVAPLLPPERELHKAVELVRSWLDGRKTVTPELAFDVGEAIGTGGLAALYGSGHLSDYFATLRRLADTGHATEAVDLMIGLGERYAGLDDALARYGAAWTRLYYVPDEDPLQRALDDLAPAAVRAFRQRDDEKKTIASALATDAIACVEELSRRREGQRVAAVGLRLMEDWAIAADPQGPRLHARLQTFARRRAHELDVLRISGGWTP